MAYFGWPEAHENDAERAARAGLAILESISRLNEKPLHAELAARVGIHSGAVVVGAGVGREADVFGDVPNIAARVQAMAEPGTLLITGDTHRLFSGLFEVEGRGAQRLKGPKPGPSLSSATLAAAMVKFMRCSKCGAANRETARFCDTCGAALLTGAPVTTADSTHLTPLAEGERRI
jgi:class 3 adenylate cyclase